MNKNKTVYSIVSAVRNEVSTIEKTLNSVVNQSIRPQKWVIINDGSNDGTELILAKYSQNYSWIDVINFEDKGYMDYESAHKRLQEGLKKILSYKNDFIVKMDADITFQEHYFEALFNKFMSDPKLGIAGGWFYIQEGGKLNPENHPAFHVRGGSKVYRWECWRDIGGFVNKLGYDMIDEIQANLKGWKTQSFREIKVIHHRKTGGSKGTIRWNLYAGKLNYIVWYHPLYVALKSIKIGSTQKPYLLSGIALLNGFIKCYLKKLPRSIYDPEFKKYIRREQLKKLTFRDTIWK